MMFGIVHIVCAHFAYSYEQQTYANGFGRRTADSIVQTADSIVQTTGITT